MTEQEWLVSEDAHTMLRFMCGQPAIVRRKAGRRRLRLFGCACCRRLWEEMTDRRTRAAVEVAEHLADDEVCAGEAEIAKLQARQVLSNVLWNKAEWERERVGRGHRQAAQAGYTVLDNRYGNFAWAGLSWGCGEGDHTGYKAYMEQQRRQALFLRCIFGNAFHPKTLNSAWLTWHDGTIAKMAQAIYDDGAFDRLPVVADALEEAGCANADLLTHCRSDGPHVRGCWVIDLLLGKE